MSVIQNIDAHLHAYVHTHTHTHTTMPELGRKNNKFICRERERERGGGISYSLPIVHIEHLRQS